MTTEIKKVQALIKRRTGIAIEEDKAREALDLMRSRIRGTPAEAIVSLQMKPTLPEWLLDTITINETFFFRHPEQFREIQSWARKTTSTKRDLHCVSLGCSTGEEPYSLAMLLSEIPNTSASVVGVDIDPVSIAKAKSGRYSEISMMRAAQPYRATLKRHSEVTRGRDGEQRQVNRNIMSMVRFELGSALTKATGSVDLILARNILIYFEPEARSSLLKRLAATLNPGGMLVIGAAELFPPEMHIGSGSLWQAGQMEMTG